MSVMQLLDVLAAKKIKLWLEGDAMRFSAPADVFTAELKAQVVEKKSEIIAFLKEAQKAQVNTIPKADRSKAIPLSLTQQRLWILNQLEPDSVAYNMPIILKLVGDLNVGYFEFALQQIVSRHESMRTQITQDGFAAFQEVNEAGLKPLSVEDISGLAEPEQKARIQAEVDSELKTPFELGVDPLFRVRLLKISPNDSQKSQHVLMMCMHHIITDGWSLGIVVQELMVCYNACIKDPSSFDKNKVVAGHTGLQPLELLPELEIQYSDFSVWQRDWMSGGELDRQLTFWRDYLPRDGFVLNLPTDYERGNKSQLAGSSVSRLVPLSVLKGFKDVLQVADATLFMGLLTVFNVLLAKYTNQTQINIGTPNAGRNRVEVEGLVGFFISTLVMSSKVEKTDRFVDVLEKVKAGAVGALSNQDTPFEKLVEEMQPERDLSRTPLFQVFFNLLNLPEMEQSFDGLEIESLLADDVDQVSKFDMTVYAKEMDQGLQFDVIYNSNLYTQRRMDVLLSHFEMVLKAVVDNADTTVAELSLVEQSLVGSSTDANLAEDMFNALSVQTSHNVLESVSHACLKYADSIAISGGGGEWTYAELEAGTNRLASAIKALSTLNVRVACVLSRSANVPLSLLAVLKADCSFSVIDKNYPVDKIDYYLGVLKPGIILISQSAMEDKELAGLLEDEYSQRYIVLPETKEAFFALDVLNTPEALNSKFDRNVPVTEVAYYSFTSGTQGKPKLVVNDLLPLSHFVSWYQQEFKLGSGDCFSMLSGVSHDPMLRDLFAPLALGATICIPDQDSLLEPGYLSRWIVDHNITVAHLTPSMGELIVQNWDKSASGLRLVCFGGEKLRYSQAQEFKFFAPDVELVNFYGATETPQAMAFERVVVEQNRGRASIIPIGVGIDGAQILVVNDALMPVGISEIGEIAIRTPYLSKGYENDAELTALKFPSVDYLSQSKEVIYRTGDLGRYLPDGRVELIGRLDDQIKVRGFRVEPSEIEQALIYQEGIKASAVKLVIVNESQQLAAYLVKQDDASIDKSDVLTLLRDKLPEYMIPQSIVWLDEIPLTPNGKTDYKSLPIPGKEDRAAQYVAPRNAVEEQLALIWEEILGTSPIGVNDSFFELGGHSLLATQVVSRINAVYEIAIPLRVLFEKPTISIIATVVEEALTSEVSQSIPAMTRVSRDQKIPISFAQNRLWFMQNLDPNSVAFNMPFPLVLNGPLDGAILDQVFQEVFRRHEIFGVNFIEESGQPYYQFNSLKDWRLDNKGVDIAGSTDDEVDLLQKQLAVDDASIPFDLAADPLIRATLYSFNNVDKFGRPSELNGFGQQYNLLLMTVHHAVSDGWSMNVFMREVVALYSAYQLKLPSPLASLKLQYADYAHWQRNWLQGEVLERQLDYWAKKLEGSPQILRLPTDKPRPALQTFSGKTYSKVLSKSLLSQLNGFSQSHQLSLFMTLIGAYHILLSRYTKTNDVCVGVPIAGRHHGDTENIHVDYG